jgi:hypothetical protein
VNEGIKFPYNVLTGAGEDHARRLETLDPADRQFRIGDAGLLDRVLWITPVDQLAAGLAGTVGDARADRARDVIGLVHRGKGDVLVSVDIPSDALFPRRVAKPTLFDGVNSRFTSVPRDPPAFAPDWGWTFDLRAMFALPVRSAGVPEQICDHEPVNGFRGRMSSFAPLGIAQLPRGDVEGTGDDAFAIHLQNGRTPAAVVAALEALR